MKKSIPRYQELLEYSENDAMPTRRLLPAFVDGFKEGFSSLTSFSLAPHVSHYVEPLSVRDAFFSDMRAIGGDLRKVMHGR
jgi:hypothetical protein